MSEAKLISIDALTEYRKALAIEYEALGEFIRRPDENIETAVSHLYRCQGKVVVSGMGKCRFVAQKIAATFSSTGTPAVFLHPAEAFHGDLGIVDAQDVVLILSNSGETREIKDLLPHLLRRGVVILAMTGKPQSTLGRASHAVIDTGVTREADPLNTAPTASTTVMLAAGDALAVALMQKRNFGSDQFAASHPGGILGQRLLCSVDELMHTGNELPMVNEDVSVRDAILEISSKRLGVTMVIDGAGRLTGLLTDGDLRRLFQNAPDPLAVKVADAMTKSPKTIHHGVLAAEALRRMEDARITSLPVVDDDEAIVGILHMHDLIRAGIG